LRTRSSNDDWDVYLNRWERRNLSWGPNSSDNYCDRYPMSPPRRTEIQWIAGFMTLDQEACGLFETQEACEGRVEAITVWPIPNLKEFWGGA
jgi:hypothetical protein